MSLVVVYVVVDEVLLAVRRTVDIISGRFLSLISLLSTY